MLKELKNKVKTFLIGEPVTDTYSMYSYKIITVHNEEYRCNMHYYTVLSFKDWVDFYLLKERSLKVANEKLINREAVKDIELLRVMDEFNYTRSDSLGSFKGSSISMKEAEELRDRNDWYW